MLIGHYRCRVMGLVCISVQPCPYTTRHGCQCMDDTFVVEVEMRRLSSFRLEGAAECHAPELAVELHTAKAEVHHLDHFYPLFPLSRALPLPSL